MRNSIQITQSSFPNRKPRQFLSIMLIAGLFALTSIVAAFPHTAITVGTLPQESVTGEWTAGFSKDKTDRIQLTMTRRTSDGNSNMGSNFSLADLQGLTREQMMAAKSDVKFRLVREAGTFDFEGTFSAGRGSGTWTLIPSQNFISDMRVRGFDLSQEKLIASAMLDVKVKTVDDLKAAGFTQLTMEDVIKATIFKITPEYISELKSAGFENLSLEELVKARIFKIDAEFVREVAAMGFAHNSLESLVKLRIFKVTPDFLREMRSAGLENLSIEDLVKLRIFKIDSDFIQRAKASGHTDLDVEELVRLRIHEKVK